MTHTLPDSVLYVNPLEVKFVKTELPKHPVFQFSEQSARVSQRGLFAITLRFRPSAKQVFIRKGPLLMRDGKGPYLTHDLANEDILFWRMKLEGFKETENGWIRLDKKKKIERKSCNIQLPGKYYKHFFSTFHSFEMYATFFFFFKYDFIHKY